MLFRSIKLTLLGVGACVRACVCVCVVTKALTESEEEEAGVSSCFIAQRQLLSSC